MSEPHPWEAWRPWRAGRPPAHPPTRRPHTPSSHAVPTRCPHRTKLLESEAMNESLRRSLSRASARGPYSLGASPMAFGGSPASSMEDASEVIRRAKQDLERLKKKEVRQRRKR